MLNTCRVWECWHFTKRRWVIHMSENGQRLPLITTWDQCFVWMGVSTVESEKDVCKIPAFSQISPLVQHSEWVFKALPPSQRTERKMGWASKECSVPPSTWGRQWMGNASPQHLTALLWSFPSRSLLCPALAEQKTWLCWNEKHTSLMTWARSDGLAVPLGLCRRAAWESMSLRLSWGCWTTSYVYKWTGHDEDLLDFFSQ